MTPAPLVHRAKRLGLGVLPLVLALAAPVYAQTAAAQPDAGAPAAAQPAATPAVATAPALTQPAASGSRPDDTLTEPPGDEPVSLLGTLIRTLVVLGIVLGLVYVTLNFGLRRLMGGRVLPLGKSTLVRVVERLQLDPKRSLFVVQAAGEYLLVGGGDEGLHLISRLDAEAVEKILAERQSSQGPRGPSPFLQKLLSRKDTTPPAGPGAS